MSVTADSSVRSRGWLTIDAVFTAVRATHPVQADCASALADLMSTLNPFDGV